MLALGGGTNFLSFAPTASFHDVAGPDVQRRQPRQHDQLHDPTPANITTSIFAGTGADTTTLTGSGPGSTVNIDSQAGANTVVLGGQQPLGVPARGPVAARHRGERR